MLHPAPDEKETVTQVISELAPTRVLDVPDPVRLPSRHPDGWSLGAPGRVSTDEAGRTLFTTEAGRRYTFEDQTVSYVSQGGVRRTSDFAQFSPSEKTQAMNHFRHVTVVSEAWETSGRMEMDDLVYTSPRMESVGGVRYMGMGVSYEERPMTLLTVDSDGRRYTEILGEDARDQMFLLSQRGITEVSVHEAMEKCSTTALADPDYADIDRENGVQPQITRYGLKAPGAVPLYQMKAKQAAAAKKMSDRDNAYAAKLADHGAKVDAKWAALQDADRARKAEKAARKANRRGLFG